MAYKMIEWTDPTGRWMVGTTDLANTPQGKWWFPARKMKISLTDYVKLIKEYGGSRIQYFPPMDNGAGDVLYFTFDKYADAHKFVLYINKLARKGAW